MKAPIFEFILENFKGSTKEEIVRCLNKSTIIVFDNINILVANKEYVYYFGSTATPLNIVKFYYKFRHLISGKIAFTRDEKILKIMAKEILGVAKNGSVRYISK